MVTTTTMYDPEALGLNVTGRIGRYEYRVRCPYHDDRRPSAEFNVEKGLFYCFGCHTSKTAAEVASDMSGALVPMGISSVGRGDDIGDDREWLDLVRNPLAMDNPYLTGRLVTSGQVQGFDIRENEDGIVFPIRDKFQTITGAQIRHYDREPKYMIHGERQSLWPMEKLEPCRGLLLYIVEGVFGVLRADLSGYHAFALMGSGSVRNAVNIIEASSLHAVAIMDPDYAGRLAAGKFVLHGVPVIVQHMEPPDEWARTDWIFVDENVERLVTHDVMEVIETEPMNRKLESELKKYWRKHIK